MSLFFSRKNKLYTDTGQAGICLSPTGLSLAFIRHQDKKMVFQGMDFIHAKPNLWQSLLKEKVAGLKLQGVETVILLASGDYQIILMPQPRVPDSEKYQAIRLQVAEFIDFALEDAVVDFIELPQKPGTDNAHMIYVIVTKQSKIEEILTLVNNSGLKLKAIDICQSALRNIALQLEDADEGQALLHLEENKSQLILFKDKTLYMMRELDWGLALYKQMQEKDNQQQSCYDLSSEIQRSLDYCASHIKNVSISRILLTPLGQRMPELLSHLSNLLGLPVREISFAEFMKNAENVPLNKEGNGTFAIGAALSQTL